MTASSLTFFFPPVCQVSLLDKEENKRDTIVDRVFRKALQDFHMELITSYSVLMKVSAAISFAYTRLGSQCDFVGMLSLKFLKEKVENFEE